MATSTLVYQDIEVPAPSLKHYADVYPRIVDYNASTCNFHSASFESGSSRPICGFAALNCIRLALKFEAEGLLDMELVQCVISSSMNEEVMSITGDLQADSHLSVEELLNVPIFKESLVSTANLSTIPDAELNDIISKWFPLISTKVHAAVFSNSEEIVMCLRMPVSGSSIYAMFDPHSRPSHPNRPAFTMSSQLDEILTSLGQILFPSSPNSSASDTTSKLYFSAHLLESSPNICLLDVKDNIKKSLDYLSAMASNTDSGEPQAASQLVGNEHVALLRTQAENWRKQQRTESSINSKVTSRSTSRIPSENKRVQNSSETHSRSEFGWQLSLLTPDPAQDDEKGNGLEGDEGLLPPASLLGVENKENISPISGSSPRKGDFSWMKSLILPPDHSQFDHTGDANIDSPLVKDMTKAGPSRVRNQEFSWQRSLEGTILRETDKETRRTTLRSDSFDVREESRLERHDRAPSSSARSDYAWQTALLQQLQEEEELAASVAPNTSGDQVWIVSLQKRIQEEEKLNGNDHGTSSSDLDWQLAVQLQAEEEVGNDEVYNRNNGVGNSSTFHTVTLPTSTPTTFECGVCGELHGLFEKIGLDDCGHNFCKVCLGTFTKTKIEEGRYPIFCPECLPDRTRTTKTQLTQEIIDQLNLQVQELERLAELQLVAHSVTLQCPRCSVAMNVDREQYGEENTLVCPLPRCGHKWCKSCNKTVASSEENHRCKNGNIDRLVRRKGWRYCPGCTTPVQKESGCNHMTCGTPACNTHFCYKCGVLIIDTTNGGDVGTAVTDHYVSCQLFEKRLKCSIQ